MPIDVWMFTLWTPHVVKNVETFTSTIKPRNHLRTRSRWGGSCTVVSIAKSHLLRVWNSWSARCIPWPLDWWAFRLPLGSFLLGVVNESKRPYCIWLVSITTLGSKPSTDLLKVPLRMATISQVKLFFCFLRKAFVWHFWRVDGFLLLFLLKGLTLTWFYTETSRAQKRCFLWTKEKWQK